MYYSSEIVTINIVNRKIKIVKQNVRFKNIVELIFITKIVVKTLLLLIF